MFFCAFGAEWTVSKQFNFTFEYIYYIFTIFEYRCGLRERWQNWNRASCVWEWEHGHGHEDGMATNSEGDAKTEIMPTLLLFSNKTNLQHDWTNERSFVSSYLRQIYVT